VQVELPEGCDHYFTMEMREQAHAIEKAMAFGGRLRSDDIVKLGGLDSCHAQERCSPEILRRVENVVLAACGTSHYATRYVELIMRRMGIFQYVRAHIASEIQD
jgi:glucosamine--fructose-6-phosphate aminotransferase (isomerizing)